MEGVGAKNRNRCRLVDGMNMCPLSTGMMKKNDRGFKTWGW